MADDDATLTGEYFMLGDIASAEGAIAAGCRFFGAYPITPATEIAERMARRLPEVGGVFIQMEDEIASMNSILGASWAGVKSMTSTSGPGFSLMLENFGLGIMMETPAVIVNVQRGGPSTGLPTLVAQQDIMQARWGSHGDYEVIALAPNSPQEMFDYTIRAFNLSEKYRLPVIVLSDEVVGHMTEKVVIPEASEIEIINRKKPRVGPEEYLMYKPDDDLVPPMANAGEGYRVIATGLTHNEKGYPETTAEVQEKLVKRLCDKILKNSKDIIRLEKTEMDDAKVVVVAFGSPSRSALSAIHMARKKGIKAGMIRLCTIWPFPEQEIRKLAEIVEVFIVPEINNGQIVHEVERCAAGNAKVRLISKLGGDIHTPQEILKVIEEVAK
ncbi:MAG: 2-oxoacid:acceptor oxidoreductase subunit alpha [Candidatus Altiarchaeota archaeon]